MIKINVRVDITLSYFIMCAWDNLPGVLTKVIDKFLLHFALDINVNMKMYSIAVAVNLYHSGTQNVALVWNIFVFLNHTREFMHCNYGADFSSVSCTGNELQYNGWDTVEVILRLKASPREGPDRKWLLPWGWFCEARDRQAAEKRQSIEGCWERYCVGTSEGAVWKRRVSLGRDCGVQGESLYLKWD